jgi:hypothetical protein
VCVSSVSLACLALPCQMSHVSDDALLSQVWCLLLVEGDYNYIIVPGFSLKASLLHSWQCPAFSKTSQSTVCVQLAEVLKEKVPEVVLVIIGAKT